jgi:hypothetical protein
MIVPGVVIVILLLLLLLLLVIFLIRAQNGQHRVLIIKLA